MRRVRASPGHPLRLSKTVEGARFENPPAPETIDFDLLPSLRFSSLTAESEVGEEPIKPDGYDSSATV